MGGERGSERTRQSGLVLHTPLLPFAASVLPSLPLSPLLAGEQVFAAFPLVSRDDVEEEAADQQEQRLSQGQLGSVSPRLLAAVPGREGGEGVQVKKKKKSVSSVCLAAYRPFSSLSEGAFSAVSG